MKMLDNVQIVKKALYSVEYINNLKKQDLNELVKISENNYHAQINEASKEILDNKNIKVVLVAGPSSSGKTTTSNLIKDRLHERNIDAVRISLDDFFIDRVKTPKLPDGSYDFECIEALDIECFNVFIDELITKQKSKMPIYDFVTGKRKEKWEEVELKDNTILIIEGIHALNPILIKAHKENIYKIYICLNSNFEYKNEVVMTAKQLRLLRRLLRDFYSRGHSISTTLDMWKNVLKGEDKYIKPFKNQANYLIDSTHLYEPLLYNEYLYPLLEKVQQTEMTDKLLTMLKYFEKTTKDIVPHDSLLWEFLVNKD